MTIKIRNLSKHFKKFNVLQDLNLEVEKGETLVILGPSGVGKSVLLKHMIGLTKPDAGSIEIDSVDIVPLREAEILRAVKKMGMLFQGAALFDSMTIEENTGFYLTQHSEHGLKKKLLKEEIRSKVNEALKMVGLEGTQDKKPGELSGGMRKRAGLARLLVYRPEIILYDEPTTGLDPITSKQINELIVKTQKELKATSVVVTHDISSALFIGDRLALLREGRIAHIGTPEQFIKIDDPIIEFLRNSITQDLKKLR